MGEMNISSVFFDLGDTLGTAVVGGHPPGLIGFDLFPYSLDTLSALKAGGLKLGVISNTGNDTKDTINPILEPTGILSDLNPELLLYSGDEGVTKKTAEIFYRAAKRAGMEDTPGRCLYVGEDSKERKTAMSAGWQVCPHPLLVDTVLEGQTLRYVRVTAPDVHSSISWREELRKRAFVPQYFAGTRGTTVFGVASARVALELVNMRFEVEFLGDTDLPLTTDLYLLRDDLASGSGFLSTQGEIAQTFGAAGVDQLVLSATKEGGIVALPPDIEGGLDAFHFDSARHGHNLKLTPDPLLWLSAPPTAPPPAFALGQARVPDDVADKLAEISPHEVLDAVKRYSGGSSLDGSGAPPVVSRHVAHSDNWRVVDQLVTDLEVAGQGAMRVRLHQFTLSGRELYNVEAELPGTSALGAEEELVLVTAHLDSTAAFSQPYDPGANPAPGADDDASGVAAVLAIAKVLAALSATKRLQKTVRFVLFNGEEQGLVGSAAYARRSKSRGEKIAAIFQMDMIGFNKVDPRSWEIHFGFEQSAAVEARSRRLAEAVSSFALQVSPTLSPAQLYHSRTSPDGDPAAGRSDHASFHAQGYPAIVVSEDFFVGPGLDTSEANPNYHRPGDNFVDEEYAAEIARAIAAAAWFSASESVSPTDFSSQSFVHLEKTMPSSREFDIRKRHSQTATGTRSSFAPASTEGVNALTGTPRTVRAEGVPPAGHSLVERALSFVNSSQRSLGFSDQQAVEFVPDPMVNRTSAGSATVNLSQQYRGLPIFQMSRTVRFNPDGDVNDAVGDTAPISGELNIEPTLAVEDAVLHGAKFLAETDGAGTIVQDHWSKETYEAPTLEIGDFDPEIVAGFPLPGQPSVLSQGPFENPIPAYLLIFQTADASRLAWHMVLTFPNYADQYVVIVAADDLGGEILYSKSTLHNVAARGNVFEFNPGIADRRMIDFPRPIEDYPTMTTTPLMDFPHDWVDGIQTIGNSTRATLNFGNTTLSGELKSGVIEFDPADDSGDDQKLLNIFYYCNYIHDFLQVLGFDEASGNFQRVNFTHTGANRDPVRARAHSGPVSGTANMATPPDGRPPLMNMGLVPSVNRHTAFDADVVFHEYVHGLSNRLVGGRLNAHALDKLQSGGMGEGWSDYYALTIQSFFLDQEKVVTGDWVVGDPSGIRRAPYDDSYPFGYGDLRDFPQVHDIGEVWCATLMMMTRKLRTALGNDRQGYKIAWQIVTDGMKLTQQNPTFLDARDAILQALDDLASIGRVGPGSHALARKAAWEAFAHFGMGVNATSFDAGNVDDIVSDHTPPLDL